VDEDLEAKRSQNGACRGLLLSRPKLIGRSYFVLLSNVFT
jgi:hypothetical protein